MLTRDAFQLKYECVAKRNHKAVLVEKFHQFLNKAMSSEIAKPWGVLHKPLLLQDTPGIVLLLTAPISFGVSLPSAGN